MKNEGSHELDVTFSEVIECKKIVMSRDNNKHVHESYS